jgi:hypothetical protein
MRNAADPEMGGGKFFELVFGGLGEIPDGYQECFLL